MSSSACKIWKRLRIILWNILCSTAQCKHFLVNISHYFSQSDYLFMKQDLSAHNFRIECLHYKLHSCTSVMWAAELPVGDSVSGQWTTTTWRPWERACSRTCSDCAHSGCLTIIWTVIVTCPGWRAGWGGLPAWGCTRGASPQISWRDRTWQIYTTRNSNVRVRELHLSPRRPQLSICVVTGIFFLDHSGRFLSVNQLDIVELCRRCLHR
jgi:hypothetical protein